MSEAVEDGGIVGGALDGVTEILDEKSKAIVEAIDAARAALIETGHDGVDAVDVMSKLALDKLDNLRERAIGLVDEVLDVVAK